MAVNVKRRQSFAVIATRMACKLLPPFRTFEPPSLKDRLGSKARHALATGRSPTCVVVRGVRISNFVRRPGASRLREPGPRRDDAATAEAGVASIHRVHGPAGTLAVEPTDQGAR